MEEPLVAMRSLVPTNTSSDFGAPLEPCLPLTDDPDSGGPFSRLQEPRGSARSSLQRFGNSDYFQL